MKNFFVIFFLVFIVFSCGNKKEKDQKNVQSVNSGATVSGVNKDQRYFYNRTIEKVIEDFGNISKKNKIGIETFEKLDFENRNFFSSKITLKKSSSYVIEYVGIDVTGLFVNIDMETTGTDLGMVESMVVNLIEVSDDQIKEDEARQLYSEILATMKKNELTNTMVYKNGMKYGIQISSKTGKVTFFIQP